MGLSSKKRTRKKKYCINDNLTRYDNASYVRVCNIKNDNVLKKIIKNMNEITLCKKINSREYILNVKYIDLNNCIIKYDIFELTKTMMCAGCKCYFDILEKNTYTIDAINPLLGHTKNNCCMLCKNCNSSKGVQYLGTYKDKPYYYNIENLNTKELISILMYHYMNIDHREETVFYASGIDFDRLKNKLNANKKDKYFLTKKLEECIESIDNLEMLIIKLRECPILSKSLPKHIKLGIK